jgi:hypothetical protein
MNNRRDWEIDHLDPRWVEGRDYQLVCGLNCIRNLDEKDHSFNVAKSNRFLPWRWSREEIGVVPQEPGDLCLFWDPATEDWVLEEYLGSWWFEKTKKHSALTKVQEWKDNNPSLFKEYASRGGYRLNSMFKEQPDLLLKRTESIRRSRKKDPSITKRITEKTEEWRKANPGPEQERKEAMIEFNKYIRFECTVTGKISTMSGLNKWQKNRGIDPSNRRRVDLRDAR